MIRWGMTCYSLAWNCGSYRISNFCIHRWMLLWMHLLILSPSSTNPAVVCFLLYALVGLFHFLFFFGGGSSIIRSLSVKSKSSSSPVMITLWIMRRQDSRQKNEEVPLPWSGHTADNQSIVEVQDVLKCVTNDIHISLFSENCFTTWPWST